MNRFEIFPLSLDFQQSSAEEVIRGWPRLQAESIPHTIQGNIHRFSAP
jgi:hypothetical protein